MDRSPPGSSICGILQARILEWLLCPLPGELPDSGTEPPSLRSPAPGGGFFTTSATWILPMTITHLGLSFPTCEIPVYPCETSRLFRVLNVTVGTMKWQPCCLSLMSLPEGTAENLRALTDASIRMSLSKPLILAWRRGAEFCSEMWKSGFHHRAGLWCRSPQTHLRNPAVPLTAGLHPSFTRVQTGKTDQKLPCSPVHLLSLSEWRASESAFAPATNPRGIPDSSHSFTFSLQVYFILLSFSLGNLFILFVSTASPEFRLWFFLWVILIASESLMNLPIFLPFWLSFILH